MTKKRILVVVDMQNDFISGTLGSEAAQSIVHDAAEIIKSYSESDDMVICTRDTHTEDYMTTHEGRNLPVKHCVRNTSGWEIDDRIKAALPPSATLIDKTTFGSFDLADSIKAFVGKDTVIELLGLCTDICVVSNAMILRAAYPENDISVYSSGCAGVTPDKHKAALSVMESCQIKVI